MNMADRQAVLEEDNRLKIAFLRRYKSDTRPTGLVRLISAYQDTIHLPLTEDVTVATIEPRNTGPPSTTFLVPGANCMVLLPAMPPSGPMPHLRLQNSLLTMPTS